MKPQQRRLVLRGRMPTHGSYPACRPKWTDWKRSLRCLVLSCSTCLALVGIGLSAEQIASSNDPLWKLATKAYRSGQTETGHIHLKTLVDKNPGDVDLALKCLEKIFYQAGRQNAGDQISVDHWAQYAARRLCALERLGAISANSRTIQEAFKVTIQHDVRRGRLLEANEVINRLVEENPHDVFWRISQARFYRRLDSSKTRPLYDKLKAEMDLDHPNATARERWTRFSVALETDRDKLPQVIQPLPKGSLLPLMEPDDPDGEWGLVANRSAREIPVDIDRLAAKALIADRIVVWRDMSGLTDPARVLDLHLLGQPKADLEPLRKLQAERFAQEDIPSAASETDTLALFRRYAWALPAQQRLLALANRMLWDGRAQSALRSFRDLLDHGADERLRDTAQVGYWTSLAQTESLFAPRTKRFIRGANNDNTARKLDEMLGDVDPNRKYTWLGKPTKASAIYKQLMASRREPPPTTAPALKDLVQHVVRIPPVSPWSSNLPAAVDLVVKDQELVVSGRNMLVMYKAAEPNRPVWSSFQRQHAEEHRRGGYYPGYFRPQFDGLVLYTRWGFSSVPHGIAAIERSTGRPLWSNEGPRFESQRRRKSKVPLGDPVLADGLLYYLQWNTQGDVNQGRGRRLSLVCFDPRRRTHVWDSTIAVAGLSTDLIASLERVRPQSAIYGNRVTVHQGAIYSNSNCGIVARSDVRDGRTDWIYYYRPNTYRPNVLNLGSPPVIAGDKVIFMPRDASRVFALDQHTGRLVWENPLVQGVQLVGTFQDLLIVRGQATIAGLDLATGEARWYRPMDGPVLGRAKLTGSSIYLAQFEELLRLDAKTGHVEEDRSWELKGERPQSFTIHGRDLYVVTDKPGDDPGREVGRPLNPSMPIDAPPLVLPLKRAWTLPRDNAKITLPPKDSVLQGTGYLISEGILECIDVSARGGIRWQRFIAALDPSIHFVGKTMLVVDHVNGRIPGLVNRVVAYDATDGRRLWEHVLPNPIQETINCGSTQIFHDTKSRIVAVDLVTGRRAWERNLGPGYLMKLSCDAERLHIFFVSHTRTAHHLLLDAQSGRTLSENTVELSMASHQSNGKAIADGYYEVTIDPVRARYVRLVALSEVNGQGWTSIAELQVIGDEGKNIPRDRWKIHKVDSFESNAGTRGFPKNAIDNDPVTWWHTQWLGGIPRHPHEIQIDLGAQQKIAGIRYLPAVIINSNGMIEDYELYVSKDGQNWGTPVAKGVLVSRIRIERAHLSSKAILFESGEHWKRTSRIFRYSMDGKPAQLVRENARLVFLKEPYYVATTKNSKNKDVLIVHRFDDDAYRFELGTTKQFDSNAMEIEGHRLVMGRRGILVADLAKKRFIVRPSDNKLKHNQNGLVVRAGSDNLLKIVHMRHEGQAIFQFDLRTGRQREFVLTDQVEPFQDRRHHSQHGTIEHFDGVLLLNDNSAVTAWISSDP